MKKKTHVILNAFLMGVAAGFLLTPLRRGVNVHVINYANPKPKKKALPLNQRNHH